MAIIYSYPETLELLPADMLIGTSTIRVAGKKKNITKNFTLELLKNFILDGVTNVQWGTITGTLSNQTDLQAALNAKQNNITLTTTGSSGPATLVGATLNVPDYSTGITVPTLDQVLTAGNTSILAAKIGVLYGYDNVNSDYGTLEFYDSGIVIKAATTNHFLFYNDDSGTVQFSNGAYKPTLNFAGVGNNIYTFQNANGTLAFTSDIPSLAGYVPDTRTISTITPLQGGGDLSANRTLSILQSSSLQDGYLSSTDWTMFNNKQSAITLTTTGSGAATLIANVLNIPTPAAATFSSLTTIGSSGSSTLVSGTLNVPTYTLSGLGGQPLATNLTSLSGLTYASTSFVKMTAAGTFTLDTNTYLTSAVTSIGMTVPSAFNVTPSTITSSGTFAITGAGAASQYVRGDGTLANFPTSTGGGASVSYYLNGSVSQGTIGGVAYKEINSVPVIGAGTDFTINADGYIAQFITDVGDPNKLLIPAGNWNFETYFSASSGGGSPRFYIELYKYNGATFTLIATNSATPEYITGGTSIDLYFTALAVPSTSLLITDRLAVRFYVIHSGRTITMHTEDSHLSQIITTFSSGLTALNGLTSQVQYLAVGTAGTDFGISSATDTHTFNLPTASATNRGALSNTDWSAFNGKFNLPSLTSGSVLFSNGTTIAQDNAQLFWDDTNNRLGIGTATPTVKLQIEIADNGISTIFKSLGGQIRVRGYLSANYGGVIESFNPTATVNERLTLSGSKIQLLDGNVLVNTFTDNGGKLQIKAPGALSTDIALRVRNSADSADLFTIAGDGSGILLRDLTINGISVGIGKNNIASNTILGFQVFPFLTTGNNTASVGYQSSFNLTTGSLNAALGVAALFGNSTGSNNVGIGFESGRYIADGTTASTIYNTSVFIGASTKSLANSQANQIVIGYNATGLGSNSVVLGNDSIVTTALKGNVGIGMTPSFKLDISANNNRARLLGTTGYLGLDVQNNAGSFYFARSSSIGNDFITGSVPYSGVISLQGNYPIYFAANNIIAQTITGAGNILIGTTTDQGGKLQVKAGGALSTDIALRVRNSADSGDLLSIAGNGSILLGTTTLFGSNVTISKTNSSLILSNSTNSDQYLTLLAGNGGTQKITATYNLELVAQNGNIIFTPSTNVLIGTTTNIASSKLTIESTTQGVLFPRMTTTQKNAIATPATGLVVFDTTLNKLCVRGASAWETITSI